jgi:hypothetical protein
MKSLSFLLALGFCFNSYAVTPLASTPLFEADYWYSVDTVDDALVQVDNLNATGQYQKALSVLRTAAAKNSLNNPRLRLYITAQYLRLLKLNPEDDWAAVNFREHNRHLKLLWKKNSSHFTGYEELYNRIQSDSERFAANN